MACEHGDLLSLIKTIFELGFAAGKDEAFREEREAAQVLPDNVIPFEALVAARDSRESQARPAASRRLT